MSIYSRVGDLSGQGSVGTAREQSGWGGSFCLTGFCLNWVRLTRDQSSVQMRVHSSGLR